MRELPSGEKKPQVLREFSGLMRTGVPMPGIAVPFRSTGATYIWYCFSPFGVAWKMIQDMSREKYASPARSKPVVSWMTLVRRSDSDGAVVGGAASDECAIKNVMLVAKTQATACGVRRARVMRHLL